MSDERFQPSYDIYVERFEKLKEVVPEAFEDGTINWDILRESLGEFVEDEDSEIEHYSFTWPGKREARRLAGKPPQGTLVPAPGEGVNEETTENVFIEGDNLEVLKLLQKSYAGRIKMIYIDPPYNTGNDFIYKDNFTQPLDEYLGLTGQIDASGKALVSNKKSDGRFHTKWLNMMYPRLHLAINLLRDDGVIFISINNNEVSNLRKMCDEIFGEENYIESFIWRSRLGKGATAEKTATLHEYVLAYCRNIQNLKIVGDIRTTSSEKKERIRQWGQGDRREDRPTMFYPVESEEFGNILPIKPDGTEGRWRVSKENFQEMQINNLVVFEKQDDGRIEAYRIIPEGTTTETAQDSILNSELVKTTAHGSKETSILFGFKIFDYPKPTNLLSHFIGLATNNKDIILDFFAGSAPTAQAVIELNKQDGGKRKFIMVQLPEPCAEDSEAFKAGYKTIADIGKERIRRVIKKLDKENEDKIELEDLSKQDHGFKVLKLQKSHFAKWQDYAGSDAQELMQLFSEQIEPLADDWKAENLVIEIMMQEGFPLHSKIQKLEDISANNISKISSDFCEHLLYICLDEKIEQTSIDHLPLSDKDIFICLDSALTDKQKVTLSDKGVIKTI